MLTADFCDELGMSLLLVTLWNPCYVVCEIVCLLTASKWIIVNDYAWFDFVTLLLRDSRISNLPWRYDCYRVYGYSMWMWFGALLSLRWCWFELIRLWLLLQVWFCCGRWLMQLWRLVRVWIWFTYVAAGVALFAFGCACCCWLSFIVPLALCFLHFLSMSNNYWFSVVNRLSLDFYVLLDNDLVEWIIVFLNGYWIDIGNGFGDASYVSCFSTEMRDRYFWLIFQ